MTRSSSSSKITSILPNGVSSRYPVSPRRDAYSILMSVLFPMPLGECTNVSGWHISSA